MSVESEMVAPDATTTTPQPAVRRAQGIVRVNLIPPEIGEAKRLRSVQIAVGAGVAVVVAGVALLYVQQSHAVDDAKAKLAAAQATNAQLQAEQSRLGNVNALYAQVDAAQAMLASAQAPQILWSRYLQDIRLQLPEKVWVTSMTLNETPPASSTGTAAATGTAASAAAGAAACAPVGSLSIAGGSYTHRDVANWLTRLAAVKAVSSPYLTGSTEKLLGGTTKGSTQLPTVSFTSTATLGCGALASAAAPAATGSSTGATGATATTSTPATTPTGTK